MQNILIYLQKFKSVGLKDAVLKKVVADILKKDFRIEIAVKDISIKDGTITIKALPISKNEIFINREKIKSSILLELRSANFGDIR